MNPKIEQVLVNTPNIIHPPIEMLEANQPISIYEGVYTLNVKDELIKIEGKIYFDWFPIIGAKFSGRIIENKSGVHFISIFENENDIKVDLFNLGKAFIATAKWK